MNAAGVLTASGQGLDLSAACFGELRRSADAVSNVAELRRRFDADGDLYLPGFFNRDEIQAVRDEIIGRLQAQAVLAPGQPPAGAVAAERATPDARAVVRGNRPLREVVFAPRIMGFYEQFLGGASRHYDHIWMRVVPPGRGTLPHCDRVYMGRGTQQVMTAWIPYSDVTLALGGLIVLEQSHTRVDRLRHYLESDADTYCVNRGEYLHKSGALSTNPVTLRAKLGGRWLTAEFRMGDLLTFGMHLVHASLDNQTRAYRLSSDTRYQLAAEPIDPRWVGPETEEYGLKNRRKKIC